MTTRTLKLVPPEGERPKDITAMLRAEIRQRDWSRVHIAADKREPVFIAERVRWLR